MSNAFSKQELVAFEKIIEGFEDNLVLAKNVSVFNTDSTNMERANDVIWRPQPYIAQSFDGMDQTGNFGDMTQLSVPATLGYQKSSPWIMDAKELRDATQAGRLGEAAKQKLSSDINVALMNVAALQGTLVVAVTNAAGSYADIALCDTIMNEQGVMQGDRCLALSSRDYNGLADDLSSVSRSFGNKKSDQAYERGLIGSDIAGFRAYKLDYANASTASAGGASITIDTRSSASNYYTPVATRVASTGEQTNIDNRYQTVTVSSTTSVAAGDSFTIAGVNAANHITKSSTGSLKTFRVISVTNATTMVISPAIVSNQGSTDAEAMYKNCIVTTSATAAIVWLNQDASKYNIFWHKDALEIIPGHYAVPSDAGANVVRASTSIGVELVWQKQYDINTMKTKFRLDTFFGVVCKQPEMAGILLFSQVA